MRRYPETSYLSYNITPRHNPKQLKDQIHRGESLRSQVVFSNPYISIGFDIQFWLSYRGDFWQKVICPYTLYKGIWGAAAQLHPFLITELD